MLFGGAGVDAEQVGEDAGRSGAHEVAPGCGAGVPRRNAKLAKCGSDWVGVEMFAGRVAGEEPGGVAVGGGLEVGSVLEPGVQELIERCRDERPLVVDLEAQSVVWVDADLIQPDGDDFAEGLTISGWFSAMRVLSERAIAASFRR